MKQTGKNVLLWLQKIHLEQALHVLVADVPRPISLEWHMQLAMVEQERPLRGDLLPLIKAGNFFFKKALFP